MTARRATAADVVAAASALTGSGTRFLAIDGFGASGKSTLAERVRSAVPGTAVVHLDDLQGDGIAEWDWDVLNRLVRELRAGRDAAYDLTAWGERAPYGTATVPSGALVVVEGVSSTRPEAVVPWDLRVWVRAPARVRRRRALARDGEALSHLWRSQWIPTEQAWAARDRPWQQVDLIVEGSGGGDGPAAVTDLGQWNPS